RGRASGCAFMAGKGDDPGFNGMGGAAGGGAAGTPVLIILESATQGTGGQRLGRRAERWASVPRRLRRAFPGAPPCAAAPWFSAGPLPCEAAAGAERARPPPADSAGGARLGRACGPGGAVRTVPKKSRPT